MGTDNIKVLFHAAAKKNPAGQVTVQASTTEPITNIEVQAVPPSGTRRSARSPVGVSQGGSPFPPQLATVIDAEVASRATTEREYDF